MAINVVCNSCGRKFVAPPEFEGKRVRCKGCSAVILITAISASAGVDSDLEADVDPLSLLAQSNAGNRTRISPADSRQQPGSVEWDDDSDSDDSSGPGGLYPNVLKFEYPGAGDVDQWLPTGLIAIGFLLLATVASGSDLKDFEWIAVLRFLTLAALYAGVIFPITLSMIRRAGRELRFAMPPQFKLRCFACYMPAIVILGWMWLSGSSLPVIMLFSGLLGLAISSAAVWLLFRLRETDIGTTSAYGAGGFAIGLTLSFGLIVGLNLIVQLIVVQSKGLAYVPVSPFGPALHWASIPPTAPAAPVIASTAPVNPSPLPATNPFAAIAGTNQIGQFETSKIPGLIDDEIEPMSTSPVVAIVRSKPNQLTVEPWNTQDWQQMPGALTLPPHSVSKFILSADGRRLAWIAQFPRLAVQIWSFADATVSSHVDLDRADGTANLIGFIDANRFLVERSGAKQAAVVDAVPAVVPAVPATTPAPAPATPPGKTGHTSIFDDFTNNPSTINRPFAKEKVIPLPAPGKTQVDTADISPPVIEPGTGCTIDVIDAAAAVTLCSFALPPLTQDETTDGKTPPSGVVHLGINAAISTSSQRLVAATNYRETPMLLQYDLVTGKSLPSIKVGEIDPSLSGSPTGLAYSNDGNKLAVLFEHSDSALLLTYDSVSNRKISEFVYPFGPLEGQPHRPFQNGAITWLDPAPFWLVYGQGLINTQTGSHLKSADLGVANVARQRLLDLDRVELLVPGPSGDQIKVLDMDPMKLGLDPDSANPQN